MLPINKKNGPCDPISSNCVIWQGPDLDCVDICYGDSISAVIAALCDELLIVQSGSGSGAGLLINQINQTSLIGGPATTETELIQLIINNMPYNSGNGSGSGHGKLWDCEDTLQCTLGVPECYMTANGNMTNPSTIGTILTELMLEHCSQTTQRIAIVESLQDTNNQLIDIKKKPTGEPNPVLQSVYVDKNSTRELPIASLVNKIEVAYGKTADNVGTEEDVNSLLSITPSNPLPLASPLDSRTGFVPRIIENPTSIAQALDTAMRLIVDLRTAVEKLQIDNGAGGILSRMVNINTFYAVGPSCVAATTNATTSTNCVDLWNESGLQFDQAVRAYTAPVAESSYELATNTWYALCPGTGARAQYLGGPTGTSVAPFWSATVETCVGG